MPLIGVEYTGRNHRADKHQVTDNDQYISCTETDADNCTNTAGPHGWPVAVCFRIFFIHDYRIPGDDQRNYAASQANNTITKTGNDGANAQY